ncbi:hypothetical protein CNECB9_1700004 [Cupriavidus necator]|uniref:N-acetyltransferase domain-containing protein n=1 Tax=Cupriavidus necator TaxID=106590 RepID=A0A1K0JG76_CUPNE|nr:hypothetical protein CNECB9_1700004 [Cupriavidus necator]
MKDTVHFKWLSDLADAEAHLIAELVECTALDGAMLGYARRMSNDEAEGFIAELRYRISKGHSLALVGVDKGKPVFFCMMTRSAMPNCRHRAELSKGVVHPAYRGQHIIPQAFREIVLKAESLDVEQGLNLVSELCTTARMQEEALFAVDHTCKLFYAMYENIYVENCRRAPGPIVLGGGR